MSNSEPNRQQRLALAMAGMAEVLKGQLSAAGLRAWEYALEDFTVEVIERACARFLKGQAARLDGQAGWMPVPEEVIAECRRVAEDMRLRELREKTNIRELLAEVDRMREIEGVPGPKYLTDGSGAKGMP